MSQFRGRIGGFLARSSSRLHQSPGNEPTYWWQMQVSLASPANRCHWMKCNKLWNIKSNFCYKVNEAHSWCISGCWDHISFESWIITVSHLSLVGTVASCHSKQCYSYQSYNIQVGFNVMKQQLFSIVASVLDFIVENYLLNVLIYLCSVILLPL